jgi:hypothetical protein
MKIHALILRGFDKTLAFWRGAWHKVTVSHCEAFKLCTNSTHERMVMLFKTNVHKES